MAMTSFLIASGIESGSQVEIYSCYLDATTGTLQLPTGRDLRNVIIKAQDTRNAAGATATPTINIATGVVTVTGIAVAALTGVSGGSAGAQQFVGTGGIIGTTITGDANFAANTMVINVSGTDIFVDKPLAGAIAAGNQFSHMTVKVIYAS